MLYLGRFLVERSNLATIKLEVLLSTFFKWSRDRSQKVNIFRKWFNLIWTIDFKEFLFHCYLLVKKSNLWNIKLKEVQSTFLKWSRDRAHNGNSFKKWFHKFSPNLIWTIDIKKLFFRASYWSKGWIWRILNWKYCSSHIWNGHVIDTKTIIFLNSDFLSDYNWTRTHNYLVPKLTLNHLDKLALFTVCLRTK